jgi:hypothetical protein
MERWGAGGNSLGENLLTYSDCGLYGIPRVDSVDRGVEDAGTFKA